jgi:hypothetical protein
VLLLASGCWWTEKELKPKPHPEELIVPPETDARFTNPPEIPKDAPKDDKAKKQQQSNDPGAPPPTTRTGGGFGGGRY